MLLCAQAATNRALSQRPFQCLMCYMMRLSKSSGFCHLAAEKHKTKTWYVKGYLFYMSCSLHCAASEAVRAKLLLWRWRAVKQAFLGVYTPIWVYVSFHGQGAYLGYITTASGCMESKFIHVMRLRVTCSLT